MVRDSGPRQHVPSDEPRVREQLERLFGGSLFGAWPELERSGPTSFVPRPRASRARVWSVRLAVLSVTALSVWGAYVLFRPGLQRSADKQRANYAEELRVFVNDGNLPRVAEFVELVLGTSANELAQNQTPSGARSQSGVSGSLDRKDPHLELILVSEATLYRYFDAERARLQLIRPFLEATDESSPMLRLAALTILSREERAARLAELERLRAQLPNRSEPAYLLATAFESRKQLAKAREAWERSEELGPAWLGQRFEQAWFHRGQAEQGAARKLGNQIVRFEPESPWARLAISTFALEPPTTAAGTGRTGDAAVPRISPVQIHFEKLVETIQAAKRNEQQRAKEQLLLAIAAVHDEPAFLLDAFDWLMADELSSLALTLTEQPGWPSGSDLAASKLSRLSAALDAPAKTKANPNFEAANPTEPRPPISKKKSRRSTKKK